jgi:hypothetical protein
MFSPATQSPSTPNVTETRRNSNPLGRPTPKPR